MPTQRPSAVHLFAPDHPALALTVKARLEAARKQYLEELAMPLGDTDYQRRAGKVNGLDEAIQICIETENEPKKGD